jgi:hypothetical protein
LVHKVDFFLKFIGSDDPMDPIDWDRARVDQNPGDPPQRTKFEAWSRAAIATKEARTLFAWNVTLNNKDVAATVLTVSKGMLDQIAKLNEGNRAWSNFGVVVLYGSSIGATTALTLAAWLSENTVRVNYLALSDLPLFQFGRDRELDRVGKLETTKPDMGSGAGSPRVPFNWDFNWANNTQPESGDVPRTKLTSELPFVRIKENRYQSLGNRVKGAVGLNQWIWSSGMDGEEIHGKISNNGWDNILDNAITIKTRFRVFKQIDDAFHIAFNAKTLLDCEDKCRIELAKL